MIIQISDIRPGETIEVRVKDSLIPKRLAEKLEIHIRKATNASVGTTSQHAGGRPQHRRTIDF